MTPGGIISTVSVIGLGYVGLPTAAAIAGRDIKVIGVDIDNRPIQVAAMALFR